MSNLYAFNGQILSHATNPFRKQRKEKTDCFEASIALISKPGKDIKRKKLQMNIPHKHRYICSEQSIITLNLYDPMQSQSNF